MKKNIIYLLIAGCSLFLGACNDDDTQYLPPVELQITSNLLVVMEPLRWATLILL